MAFFTIQYIQHGVAPFSLLHFPLFPCFPPLVSQTQELLTKIHTICVEIHDIKRTSQKQYIKTPFKGQDKGSPQTTDRNYSNPPHKEEEQGGKQDCSHMASTSPSPSSPPTGSSCTRTRCAGEEASSPATYHQNLPPNSSPWRISWFVTSI